MNRLPVARLDPLTHPDPDIVGLCRAYARRGVVLHLMELPTDHPGAVFLGLAVQESGDGPAAVVGLGADVDRDRAAAKALFEVGQIRPALRGALRSPTTRDRVAALVAEPHSVADLDDHDLLYTDPSRLGAFDFLLDGPLSAFHARDVGASGPDGSAGPGEALRLLVEHFASIGGDVVSCDLTVPALARLGLFTARVIVPGFQPIHFGWKETRLGGTRLFDLPHRLGLRPRPATPADLNDDPHPLA
jgi:ribosomal protein S12 methylthiotransferase accessory factor